MELVDEVPETLEDGILYVSPSCRVALHNCACGCGEEVATPLVPKEYELQVRHGEASLWPSIGNHDFPCRSHYVVEHGRIVWAGPMSRVDIEKGRAADRLLKRPARGRRFGRLIDWIGPLARSPIRLGFRLASPLLNRAR